MRDPVRLDWRVPADEWQQFRRYVESEFGSIDGYLGREAELAMKEYADKDGYADVEKRVDRLVEAAGRRPSENVCEKTKSFSGQDTTRVTARVDERIKDEFRAVAREDDDSFGVVFARAIQTYRNGGRAGRLEQKLDRIADDAESLLSELNDDSDNSMGAVERKTVTICSRLDNQFTDDVLVEEIHDVAGEGHRASEYTVEKYRGLVTERLGVEPHPHVGTERADTSAERLWVPTEVAAKAVPESMPRECRQPTEMLDREDRIRRLQLEAGHRAGNDTSGRATVRRDTARKEVLDNEVDKETTEDLMNAAALVDGFRIDESVNSCALICDLETLGYHDEDLFETIMDYRDADVESAFVTETDASLDNYSRDEGQESTVDVQADDEMNQIMQAATDGGRSSTDMQ